jgi:hypothetical protein
MTARRALGLTSILAFTVLIAGIAFSASTADGAGFAFLERVQELVGQGSGLMSALPEPTSTAGELAPSAPLTSDSFTTPGSFSWVAPAGVTSVQVEAWGGGGSGGSATGQSTGGSFRAAAGGGAGGCYVKSISVPVTPGNSYTVTVGAGGVAVSTNGVATPGNDSWFSTAATVIAKGGAGASSLIASGADATSSGGTGSSIGCIGDTVFAGGNGAAGTNPSGSGNSGGGGSSAGTGSIGNNAVGATGGVAPTGGGAGANGRTSSGAAGSTATQVGGGGGGGWAAASTTLRAGGAGGPGKIVLTYTAAAGSATKLAITSISPANPAAGSTFSVTVQAQDSSSVAAAVTADTNFTLSNTGGGTIGGNTTGTITAGTSSITVTGVTLSSPGTGVTLTATRTSGDNLTSGTSSPFKVLSAEPTVQASAVVFSNITDTGFTASWTPGNGSSRLVTIRALGITAVAPSDGSSYTANTAFSSGSTTGSSNFVVSAGSSNSVAITGMNPGMPYVVNVYEFNGSGGTQNYLTTSPATATQSTFSLVSWNFPNSTDDAIADSGIAANLSKTIATFGGTNAPTFNFDASGSGGTTSAMSATGWDSGSGAKGWKISLVSSGYENLHIWSKQRSSGTGPRDFKVQYSVDDSTYVDVPSSTIAITTTDFTTGIVTNLALPAATANQPNLYLRWIMTSNTSENGATVASTGTSQIDDIVVDGSLVPTPTVISVSPTSGPAAGGNSVTITGANLSNATGVSFGGTPATGLTNNTATSITVTAPPQAAGQVDVTVTTAGGTSATGAGDKYTYFDPFTLDFVGPTDGSTNVATSTALTVSFNRAANPGAVTVSGNTSCLTGSVQLSSDNFATCVALGAPVGSNGDKTYTITPQAALANSTVYKIRVTQAVQDTNGVSLDQAFTQPNGWTTGSSTPQITATGGPLSFGNVTIGNTSAAQSYWLSCSNATQPVTITPPADFQVSINGSNGSFANPQTVSAAACNAGLTVWVRFVPSSTGPAGGNIAHTSSEASTQNLVISGTGVAASCAAQPTGMVAWYRGEGDALDSRGNDNGTFNNSAYVTGKVGNSFGLAGSTANYIATPASPALDITQYTVDLWIYPTTVGTAQYLVDKGDGTTDNFDLALTDTDQVEIDFTTVAEGHHSVDSIATLPLNTWSHIGGTYDGTTEKVFINGLLDNSATFGATPTRGQTMVIGKRANDTFPFTGRMDEIEIFNRALTGAEIASIYNASTAGKCTFTGANGPAGWWPGDGHSRDIIGGDNGILQGGVSYAVGEVGQTFSLDGTGFIVTDVPPTTVTDNWTLEAWVNPANLSQPGFFMTNGFDDGNTGNGYAFGMSGGKLIGVMGGVTIIDSGYAFPAANQWYHVTMLRDNGTTKFYVNGVQTPNTSSTAPTTPSEFRIGSEHGIRFFQGRIDEPTIYTRPLSGNEIQSIFNVGVAGKYKSAPTETGNVTVNAGGDATVTFSNVTTAGTTQQVPVDLTPYLPLPNGQSPVLVYDISTSAVFSPGTATICFHLPLVNTQVAFEALHLLHFQNGGWVDVTGTLDFSSRTACTVPLSSLSPVAITSSLPTAAGVTVSGRVLAPGGGGLRSAAVVMTNSRGVTRRVLTNAFGYYMFEDIGAGGSYVMTVQSRRYAYSPRIVQVSDTLARLDFTPIE